MVRSLHESRQWSLAITDVEYPAADSDSEIMLAVLGGLSYGE